MMRDENPLVPAVGVAVLLVASLALWSRGARAEPAKGGELRVSAAASFGGFYRKGEFSTSVVEIHNRGEDRTLEVAVTGPGQERRVSVDIASGGRKRVRLTAPLPNVGSWRVEVRDEEREPLVQIVPKMQRLGHEEKLMVYVGRRPPGLKNPRRRFRADEFDPVADTPKARAVRVVPAELPEIWLGYQPVDVLFWAHPEIDALSPAQLAALERWILAGGHLVVAVDDDWREIASGPLAAWLPAAIKGVEVVEDPDRLLKLLGPSSSLGELGRSSPSSSQEPLSVPERLPLLKVDKRPGARPGPAASSSEEPLTLVWQRGDGLVTLWRVDWHRTGREPSLKDWRSWTATKWSSVGDRERLWDVVRIDEPKLDINIFVLIAVLLGYVIIIGPVDYLVLRRLGRLEWTVWTYSAAILVFSGLAWVAIGATQKESTIASHLEFVEWFSGHSGGAAPPTNKRVHAFDAYFTTERSRVQFDPGEDGEWTWVGQPFQRGVSGVLNNEQALVGTPPRLEVTAAAYAMLPVRRVLFERDDRRPVEVRFGGERGGAPPQGVEPEGVEVTNRLSYRLGGCHLFFGAYMTREAFEIGPGEAKTLSLSRPRKEIYDAFEGEALRPFIQVLSEEALIGDRWEMFCRVDDRSFAASKTAGLEADRVIRRTFIRFVF